MNLNIDFTNLADIEKCYTPEEIQSLHIISETIGKDYPSMMLEAHANLNKKSVQFLN